MSRAVAQCRLGAVWDLTKYFVSATHILHTINLEGHTTKIVKAANF